MSARHALSVIVIILAIVLPGMTEARDGGITQQAYSLELDELQSCFGMDCHGTTILINVSPVIELNHALIIRGSGADASELSGLETFASILPVDERMVLDDDERSIGGCPIDDFDLIVIGGPGHNAYTRELIESNIIHYRQTNVTGYGLVIEMVKTKTGHTILVIGTTAGYPADPSRATAADNPADPSRATAAVLAGASLGIIGTYLTPFFSRTFEFVYGYISTYAGEVASEKEAEIRKVRADTPRRIALMGYSWPELVIAASCILLFGVAFVIADGMDMSPGNVLVYVTVGGFVVVAHDLGHRLVAYWLKVDAEFKFWGLGSATMLLTSYLFGLAFAQPGRVIIEKEDHHADEMAKIMLAGPAVSLALSIIFLLMTPLGGAAGSIGLLGFSMNMVTVVYSLMPFDPMDGKSIFMWNRTCWAVMFVPVTLLFIVATYFIL